MKQQTQTPEATTLHTEKWENELQALKNAVISLDLKGYEVYPNHNGFRKKTTYFLRDENGNTVTGSWDYTSINHFIMGYGKSYQKAVNERQALLDSQKNLAHSLVISGRRIDELKDLLSRIVGSMSLEKVERFDLNNEAKELLK